MTEQEIIEIFETYSINQNVLNDDNFYEKFFQAILLIGDVEKMKNFKLLEEYLEKNLTVEFFSNFLNFPKTIERLSNDLNLLDEFFDIIVDFPSVFEVYEKKCPNALLEYIKKVKIKRENIINDKKLFAFVARHDQSLGSNFNLERLFPELTEEILKEYGSIIINYIQSNENLFYSWKNSQNLFDYLYKNRRDLLYKMDLEKFLPELTEEIINANESLILKYIEDNIHSLVAWRSNKLLFDYLYKNGKLVTLLSNFNLGAIFPELTEEILKEYESIIINYIQKNEIFFSKWGTSTILFNYLYENRKDLLYKMDLEKIFPEPTEEILDEYGSIIIDYVQKNESLYYDWRKSPILFNYLYKNSRELLYKMDLEKVFPELTDEIFKQFLFDSNNLETKEIIFNQESIKLISDFFEIDKNVLEQKLKELYLKNDELFRTLNFNILKIDGLNMNLLHKFTLYPKIQEKIINLDSNTLQYFIKIANILNKEEYDLTVVIEKVLNNITKYNDLLNKLSVDELDEEKIKNLVYVLERSENIFNIESIEDLSDENFNIKKDEYFKNVADNLVNMDILEIKKAIFEKKYGIDYETAKFIYERYYYDLEELREANLDPKIMDIIEMFHKIMSEKSVEKLKELYDDSKVLETDFYTSIAFESTIRSKYADMYKQTLYHVNENDRLKLPELQNVTYKGKHIQFYEVNGNFNMQTHTLGAYGLWEEPEDYQKKWNMPSFFVHGICTTYIGNNQIAPAVPRSPILGFIDYEYSALLLSGNYDLGSKNKDFSITTEKPAKFLPPKVMIDRTRHTHNEMVIDRMIQGSDSTITKRKPSYIVYVVDDINNPDAFDASKNKLYKMNLQAAADFDVPIVIVDRLKFAKRERIKCDELEKIFYETNEPRILKELFLTYMTNSVGCREYGDVPHAEYHEMFSDDVVNNFINKILLYFRDKCSNLENSSLGSEYISKLGNNIVTLIKLLAYEEKWCYTSNTIDYHLYHNTAKEIYELYRKNVKNLNINVGNMEKNL